MDNDTPSTLLAAARPGLSQLLDTIRAKLSPEARAELDAHETRAEHRLSEAFADLRVLWRLKSSDMLYARASDVAQLLGVDPSVISHRTERRQREFGTDDVRRGVTDKDVDRPILYESQDCLTTSPRGVMMLSLRAIRRLMMTCTEERGIRFRDSIDALVEEANQLERIAIGLQLTDQERRSALAPVNQEADFRRLELQSELRSFEMRREAFVIWNAHLAKGKPVPRQLVRFALTGGVYEPPQITSPAVLAPTEKAFQPPFTFRGLRALGAGLGCSWQRARQRLVEVGLWEDVYWHQVGEQTVARAGRVQNERVHVFREGIVTELLRREQQGDLFPPARTRGADQREQDEG